jgi:hypothetical protein
MFLAKREALQQGGVDSVKGRWIGSLRLRPGLRQRTPVVLMLRTAAQSMKKVSAAVGAFL